MIINFRVTRSRPPVKQFISIMMTYSLADVSNFLSLQCSVSEHIETLSRERPSEINLLNHVNDVNTDMVNYDKKQFYCTMDKADRKRFRLNIRIPRY